MFCRLVILQVPITEQDGSILIKIVKTCLKISLGKTHLVELRATRFWLEAEGLQGQEEACTLLLGVCE